AAIRVPGVVASCLACLAIAGAALDLTEGPWRLKATAGLIAGLLLATAPASIQMTATAKPQPFVELLLVLNVWLLCRLVSRPSATTAACFGGSVAGQFVAMEYAPLVVAFTAVAALSARRRPACGADVGATRWLAVISMCAAVTLIAWPSG